MKVTRWSDLKIKSSKEQKILMSDKRKRDGSVMILSCIEEVTSSDEIITSGTTFVIRSVGQRDHFISKTQLLRIAEFSEEVTSK